MNRLCPQDEILSEYLSGLLSDKEKKRVEKHLISCKHCRTLIIETHEIMSKRTLYDIRYQIIEQVKRNIWVIGTIMALICSFIFSGYFFQFLTAALIMGTKWIINAKSTKTLIMVNKLYKEIESTTKETIKKEEEK